MSVSSGVLTVMLREQRAVQLGLFLALLLAHEGVAQSEHRDVPVTWT